MISIVTNFGEQIPSKQWNFRFCTRQNKIKVYFVPCLDVKVLFSFLEKCLIFIIQKEADKTISKKVKNGNKRAIYKYISSIL